MAGSFYARYLMLIDEIERLFPVSAWRSGDLDLWPLARMDLYLDMYWAAAGMPAPAERSLPLRIAGRLAMPLRNRWKARHDPDSQVVRPAPAHAVFLGDGVSLDCVDGKWRDRFGEPLIAALEARGRATFLMQGGALTRLPWYRPTFAANLVESRGHLRAWVTRLPLELPGHGAVLEFLTRNAVRAPSWSRSRLEHRASIVAATAAAFEPVLRVIKPSVAFVVAYYAGLGPAFLLACRRQGIPSVDLQRSAHGGVLQAYRWSAVPARGYATLPTIFWSWTKEDTARVAAWTARLAAPWHSALHGGHTQLTSYLHGDARFASIGDGARFEREILVTLQPIHGHRAVWEALRRQIEAAPKCWRWWIRRHPASRPDQDLEAASLLAMRPPNVLTAEASTLPLPMLLRHMSAVLSLASGAAVEASMFGVPAFFLIEAARDSFADLIARGAAAIIDVGSVNTTISGIHQAPISAPPDPAPPIEKALVQLEERTRLYRRTHLTNSLHEVPVAI